MQDRPATVLVALAALALVVGSVAPVAAGGTTTSPSAPSLTGPGDTAPATTGEIKQTQVLALTPDRPGELAVTIEYAVPSNVVDLEATLEQPATPIDTSGFSRTGDRTYTWDGTTRSPSVTLRYAANETGQVLGPEGAAGSYVFADVGDWAIARRLPVTLRYRYSGDVTLSEDLQVAGEGVAGDTMAYLGPHRTTTREAGGQTFRLVQPRAASLAPAPEDVFGTVTAAAETLRVGDRDDRVTMIAAPTSVSWAANGLQVGDGDFFVVADQAVDVPDNTWLHEYVHTRQNQSLGDDTRWFREGSATYYAAALTLDQERISFEQFRAFLERGADRQFRDVTLADPDTWHDGAEYWKGALVAGTVDRRLREATDRAARLQRVWRRLNGLAGPVDQSTFLGFVADAGGADVADVARRYTEGTSPPEMWSQADHQAAFGALPARVADGLPDPANASAWRVSGEFRTATLDAREGVSLVTGESLTVDVPVTNTGGESGAYALTVHLDGRTVAERSGTVPPHATVWEPVTVTPATPGSYTLAVGDDRTTVTVRSPAALTVGPIRANRTHLSEGATVRVAATVSNRADRPGEATVPVTLDGTVRDRRTVRLPAGATTEVAATVRLETRGTHRIGLGNRSVAVTVTAPTTAGSPGSDGTRGSGGSATPTDGGAGPGFGPALALAGLLLVALGLARRRPH